MACSLIPEDDLENVNDVTAEDQTDSLDSYDPFIQTDMLDRIPECLPVEETNFLRFYLVIHNVASEALRQKFDETFPPNHLEAIFQEHKNDLNILKQKGVITPPQWRLMFPGSCPSSSNFDITLMMCLFRHLAKISPKSGRYGTLPPPSDVTVGGDLARIKYYRNKIDHYLKRDMKIDNHDLRIVWEDISKALCRIGGDDFADKCSKVLTTNLDGSCMGIYRDLCIKQQQMLKDPIRPHQRENIKKELTEWESKDTLFVETSAAKELMRTLQQEKFVIVTGAPGTGKSFTAQHVLLNLNTEYDIIPVKSSSEIIDCFSSEVFQIFYIDDFCGKWNISNNDIENWRRNKKKMADVFKCPKTMCVLTCRSQIYKDSKFQKLNLKDFKVIDLLGIHRLSLSEKKSIAKAHLGNDVLKGLQDETIKNSLCFPLLCSIFKTHGNESISFFEKPTKCLKDELDDMKAMTEIKYACVAICVMLNNSVASDVFTFDVSIDTKQMIEQVFAELQVNITTPRKTIISQFEAMLGSYFEKSDTSYKAIHDYLFDIFCSHVSETMIECVINYADSTLISERVLLESLKQNKESAIIIPEKYEQSYFQRITRDINGGKIETVFGHQMQYKSYRGKLISFLNKRISNVIDNNEFLLMCSMEGFDDLVTWLCDSGANVNQCDTRGISPLFFASLQGHKSCVDILLNNSADVNKSNDDGQTPLYIASFHGQSDIVKVLCEREADVNQCDNGGRSALWIASAYGHSDIVKILCERGANVNQGDNDECSPLYVASQNGYSDIVKTLCEKRADVNQCDNDGCSPMYVASLMGHGDIVAILCDRGANVNQGIMMDVHHCM